MSGVGIDTRTMLCGRYWKALWLFQKIHNCSLTFNPYPHDDEEFKNGIWQIISMHKKRKVRKYND